MKLQAFTIVMTGTADDRNHDAVNHKSCELNLTDEVVQAVCDKADVGLKIEDEDGKRYMSPVGVCKDYLLPCLLALHTREKNAVSTTLRIVGETHCASLKIASAGGTVKHNVNKRIGELVWNYAWLTESGHLAMFYIGKRKGKTVALRDRNGNTKHIPTNA